MTNHFRPIRPRATLSLDSRALSQHARTRNGMRSTLDLHTIETVVRKPTRASTADWRAGDAWLAGGSWLFSEPQTSLRRLFDLHGFGWAPIEVDAGGVTLASTCRIAELRAWEPPPAWDGVAALVERCCRALLGSFKVWSVATVGGNICLALPAGPMTALAVALEGELTVWGADGIDRTLSADRFVLGDQRNALRSGDILRAIRLPARALHRRFAIRQISLSPLGRSGALLIGTRDADGAFALTVTASTVRPFRLVFPGPPGVEALLAEIGRVIPLADYHDDVHGRPDWRAHVTRLLAGEILAELAA